jgi:hypothetical protein
VPRRHSTSVVRLEGKQANRCIASLSLPRRHRSRPNEFRSTATIAVRALTATVPYEIAIRL